MGPSHSIPREGDCSCRWWAPRSHCFVTVDAVHTWSNPSCSGAETRSLHALSRSLRFRRRCSASVVLASASSYVAQANVVLWADPCAQPCASRGLGTLVPGTAGLSRPNRFRLAPTASKRFDNRSANCPQPPLPQCLRTSPVSRVFTQVCLRELLSFSTTTSGVYVRTGKGSGGGCCRDKPLQGER